MGDMGDLYRDWNQLKAEQRAKNLASADATGWTQHTPYHWSRDLKGKRLDYWPSRRKWQWDGRIHTGDVEGFIRNRS